MFVCTVMKPKPGGGRREGGENLNTGRWCSHITTGKEGERKLVSLEGIGKRGNIV